MCAFVCRVLQQCVMLLVAVINNAHTAPSGGTGSCHHAVIAVVCSVVCC